MARAVWRMASVAIVLVAICSQANADWLFPHPSVSPSGDPRFILSPDLDGDGHLDVIVTAYDEAHFDVLLGNGDGTFDPPVAYATTGNPLFMVLGEFNGDGHQDLAQGHFSNNAISVFLGNGDGTFGAESQYGQATLRAGIAIGDFNEDGEQDLMSMGASSAFLLFGQGDGTFSGELTLPGQSYALAVDDFDGDDLDDYVYGFGNDADLVAVELGNGDGTFTSVGTFAVGQEPKWIGPGDLNGDDIPDLVVANTISSDISVLIGNGDGTFAAEDRYAISDESPGPAPVFTIVTDLDEDGVQDIAVSSIFGSPSLSLLYGVGGGQLAPFVVGDRTTASGEGMTIEDFDEDGIRDLLRGDYGVRDLNLLMGDGKGAFVTVNHEEVGDEPRGLAVADLNGDGRLDLVTANHASDDVSVLLADAAGSFAQETLFCVDGPPCVSGHSPSDVDVGELTGDADLDLAVINRGTNTISILEGDGAGGFTVLANFGLGVAPVGGPTDTSWPIVVGDFNGDENDDLIATRYLSEEIRVFLGNGDGTFVQQPAVTVGLRPRSLSAADIDGDPDLDLVVTNQGSNSVNVLLGNGDGSFTRSATLLVGEDPTDTAVGDLDGDGIADLVVVPRLTGGMRVYFGNGNGTFGLFPLVVPGSGNSALIADLDGDTHPDIARVGGSGIRITPGRGDGTFHPSQAYRTGNGAHNILAVGDFNLDGRLDLVNTAEARGLVSVHLNQAGPRALAFLSDRESLVWPAVTGALSYDIYRGDSSDLIDGDDDGLPDAGYGVCLTGLDPDSRDTVFADPDVPSTGAGFFYLLGVVTAAGPSGVGTTSAGQPRVPAAACP